MVDGSGERSMTSILDRRKGDTFGDPGVHSFIAKKTMIFMEAMSLEAIEGEDPTYGYAYETAAYVEGGFRYFTRICYCDVALDYHDGANENDTRSARIYNSCVFDKDGEANQICWLKLLYPKNEVEISLIIPPGQRQFIKDFETEWKQKMLEEEHVKKVYKALFGKIVLYCVRVTVRVGSRTLRPIHFVYSPEVIISLHPSARANSVYVQIVFSEPLTIDLHVVAGENFKHFMLLREGLE